MKDVTLLKGMFYDSQMKGKEYLLFFGCRPSFGSLL